MIEIDSRFDSGNAVAVSKRGASVALAIRADSASPFRQWFHFRARGRRGARWRFAIVNANETTYADAWDGHAVVASYDRERWFRIPARYDGRTLSFSLTAAQPACSFAYFAAHPLERHERMVRRAASAPGVVVEHVARSVQGRDIPVLTFGLPSGEGRSPGTVLARASGKRQVWVVARQHPGESMGGWFVEGLLRRLCRARDRLVRSLLEDAVVHVVPTLNPDGVFLGNHRTNAAGADLNRAWAMPSRRRTPEVLGLRSRLKRDGVDLFVDVHGDERNPYCFLSGCEGNPGYSDRIRWLENLFEQTLADLSPDFEPGHDQPDPPGGGDLRTAANWVGQTFDCLSLTIEQPFRPDPEGRAVTWAPDRAMRLGSHVLETVALCLPRL